MYYRNNTPFKEENTMVLHYNVNGEARKAMVRAVEKETGFKAKYLGMPSAAYQVGAYKIEKDGTLSWKGNGSIEETGRVVDACVMATGITPTEWEGNTEEPEEEATGQAESTELSISLPLGKVNVGNLINLLEAKGELIKKALGINDLKVEVDEEEGRVSFPWFATASPDETKAYTDFIAALCRMSSEQKRVTAKAKENENEKYAFRCFLLRLGFIGNEYKSDRKVLLKNLEGSSAFKGGRKGGEQ